MRYCWPHALEVLQATVMASPHRVLPSRDSYPAERGASQPGSSLHRFALRCEAGLSDPIVRCSARLSVGIRDTAAVSSPRDRNSREANRAQRNMWATAEADWLLAIFGYIHPSVSSRQVRPLRVQECPMSHASWVAASAHAAPFAQPPPANPTRNRYSRDSTSRCTVCIPGGRQVQQLNRGQLRARSPSLILPNPPDTTAPSKAARIHAGPADTSSLEIPQSQQHADPCLLHEDRR